MATRKARNFLLALGKICCKNDDKIGNFVYISCHNASQLKCFNSLLETLKRVALLVELMYRIAQNFGGRKLWWFISNLPKFYLPKSCEVSWAQLINSKPVLSTAKVFSTNLLAVTTPPKFCAIRYFISLSTSLDKAEMTAWC